MKHVEFYLMRCCRAFVLAYLLLVAGGHDSEALGKEYTHTITYGKIAETQRGYRDFVQVVFIKVPIEEHRPVYARLSFPSCDAGGTGGFSGDRYAGARFRILGGDGACSNPALKKVAPSFEEIYSGKVIVDKEYGSESFREKPWMTMALLRPEDGELIGTSRYYKLVVEGDARADGKPFLMAISRDPDGNCPVGAEVFCYSVITRSTVPGCVFLEKMSLLVDGEKGLEIGGVSRGSAVGIEAGFWADMPVRFPEHDDWLEEAARLDEGTVRRTCSLTFKGGAYPGYGTLSVTDQEGNLLPLRLPVYCGKGSQQLSVESLSDCGSFAFDATRVKDPYGCSREFIWKFGDGTAESGTTVVHHYEVPGNYDVSVHVADVFEVVDSVTVDRFTVAVNHPPIASAGADLIGVPGTELTFDGSKSRDPDGHVSRYEWDFGEGQTMSGKTVTHIYPEPNFYTATLVVEDDSGSHCNTGTDTCRVWINDPPVAEIGGGGIASPGEKITFSGGKSVDRDGKIIGYRWDFGDGATAGGAHVTHAYREAGTYEVTLGVTDDSGAANKTAFDQVTVFVNSPPIAEAGSDKRASVEEGITFDGSQSYDRDGELVAYHWDFGDGSGGEGVTVVHTYQEPGRYGITLTVKDNSQSTSDLSRDRALVIINSPPVAEAGPDQTVSSSSVCFDGTKSFDADGALIEYRWDFGDGSYGEGVSPVHVYSNPGSYTVRLTVDDDSMTSSSRASDEATVRVNCFPIADAGPDLVGAPGCALGLDGSASVDPDGEITAYKWNLGDGTTAFGRVVIHHYSRPGTYSALLTVHDNSGHDAAVGFDECRVLINRAPVAIAGKDLVVAPGETVCLDGSRSFDPDGVIASYQWEFSDDEGAADSAGVSRSFPRSGVFSATLTVVDDSRVENSAARDTVVIRVNDGPEARAGGDIYTNERRVFFDGSGSSDADGDRLTYRWDFGDGSERGRGEKVYHTYEKGGRYPVVLTVDDGTGVANGWSSSSVTVNINEAPVADAGGDREVCGGKVVIFDGSGSRDPEGGVLKYFWDFGDGSSAWGVNPTKTYMRGGVYGVTLKVSDDSGLAGGDTGIDRVVVRVVESPVADAGGDQAVCVGTPVQFDGTKSQDADGVVNDFQWDFGDGATGGGAMPLHVYAKAGIYRIVLTVTGDRRGECDNTDRDEVVVTVHEGPVAEVICPAVAAEGETIIFDGSGSEGGSGGIIRWEWDFGDGVRGEGKRCEHRYDTGGVYDVTLRVESDSRSRCNTAVNRKQIKINKGPAAKAGGDRLIGVNEVVTFDGSLSEDSDGVISSYRWDFGDGQRGSGMEVRHQYESAGEYRVVLEVRDDADVSSSSAVDTVLVTVNEAPAAVITGEESICAGDEVVLSARRSGDGDGEIVKYDWEFGDGTRGEGMEVRHRYEGAGSYEVVLGVDDGRKVSNSYAQAVMVVNVKRSPGAEAGFDRIVSPGEEVVFKGTASVGEGDGTNSFQWEFGDGDGAEGEQVSHQYDAPGDYRVRLTVGDASGGGCVSSDDITVRVNSPPVVVLMGPGEAVVGGAHDCVFFDASGSYDPDGDGVTFLWDFGDGGKGRGARVLHCFENPGQYTVSVFVDDGNGVESSVVCKRMGITVYERK